MLTFNENEFEKNENSEINSEEINENINETSDNAALTDAETQEIAETEAVGISEEKKESADDDEEVLTKKESKKQMKKAKKLANKGSFINSFKTRSSKAGTYMFAVCAIALAAVIVLNMIAGKLPSSIKSIDTTKSDLYSISDYSEQIVKNINVKVTIYLVATKGSEDVTLSTLLDRYASLNDNIKVEQKDPELSRIADEYSDTELSENSLIFVSDKRSKTVDYSSMYEYSEEMQQYAYSGYEVSADIFDGENEITSALGYVTTDVLPKVYTLTGHGETKLSAGVLASISGENIETAQLDLMKAKQVPADCECIIANNPASDISSEEKKMMLDYLGNGGKLFVTTGYKNVNTPNFAEILENYGVQRQVGLIFEGDQNFYAYNNNYPDPTLLIPEINSHEITDPIADAGYNIFMPVAHGITETAAHRSTLQLTSLLSTSKSAYIKENPTEDNYEKAEGDLEGPFSVGYAISETHGETETRIVWFSTSYILEDALISYPGNLNLLLNSLKWMCKLEKNISIIESKSLAGTDKLEITSGEGMLWNIMFIGVLPVASIVTGLAIWIRRKKR